MDPAPLLAYFGHHRCGSTWLSYVSYGVCANAGLRMAYLPDEAGLAPFGGSLPEFVRSKRVEFLCYANADLQHVRALDSYRGFHVIRDPRDLLVSAYFSHLQSHSTEGWPELAAHRGELQRLSKSEGLLSEMEFNRRYFDHMARWDYGQENVLELRLEDLSAVPYAQFLRIFEFLGLLDEQTHSKRRQLETLLRTSLNVLWSLRLSPFRARLAPFPAERILGIVHQHRFSRLTRGRRRGEENVASHYRKGLAGDWVNHFEDVHVAEFKARYGDLLLQLGYETSRDWTRP